MDSLRYFCGFDTIMTSLSFYIRKKIYDVVVIFSTKMSTTSFRKNGIYIYNFMIYRTKSMIHHSPNELLSMLVKIFENLYTDKLLRIECFYSRFQECTSYKNYPSNWIEESMYNWFQYYKKVLEASIVSCMSECQCTRILYL